jgi:hypothetical protein
LEMEQVMTIYYKAVRPDGTDFYGGTVRWAPPENHDGEWIVRHPTSEKTNLGNAATYLSVSTEATDCTGMNWPCRLFEVEAVGETGQQGFWGLPSKVIGLAFRVIRELPAWKALGPQGQQLAALLDRIAGITQDEVRELLSAQANARGAARGAARDAARDAVWGAARVAARDAAWDAALDAAWGAVWDAALAVLVRDLISEDHFVALTKSWIDAGLPPVWDEMAS